jgi:predicted glycoside hydrolase/deacetylase ChbG (UPF0249 family)
VEIGLHLELFPHGDAAEAGDEQAPAEVALGVQLDRFERLFGRPAAFLDGHHHCHAKPGAAEAVAREAGSLGLPVRSIDAAHRRLLRRESVATADRLVGRLVEGEDALPDEVRAVVTDGRNLPAGVTEWMVHPGHPDPGSGSTYDAGRKEDLDLLLGLAREPRLTAARRSHRDALG